MDDKVPGRAHPEKTGVSLPRTGHGKAGHALRGFDRRVPREYAVNRSISASESFRAIDCRSRPLSLFIVPTNACNVKCIMCPRVMGGYSQLPYPVFEKLWPLLPHIGKLFWQGGEVFMAEYFRPLLEKIRGEYPHISHQITTNGLLLNRDWAELFSGMDIELAFSIDSAVKTTYEYMRKGARFEKILGNLEVLKTAYGKKNNTRKHCLNVVVMKSNMYELDLLPEFCLKYDMGHIRLLHLLSDMIPGEDIFIENDAKRIADLGTIVDGLDQRCRAAGIHFECLFRPLLPSRKGDVASGERMPGSGVRRPLRCIRPWTNLFIGHDGSVKPSCECKIPVGNILTESVDELWNNGVMKLYRKKLLEGDTAGWCSTEQCAAGLTGNDTTAIDDFDREQ